MNETNPYRVVIDTREKIPYEFSNSIRKALTAGDYSLEGLEHSIAIERKSKADIYSTISQHRERFIRELEKLSKFQYAAIIIESSFKAFTIPPQYSQLHPNAAVGSLLTWSVRYNIHIHFPGDREMGNKLTTQLLEKYWRHFNG